MYPAFEGSVWLVDFIHHLRFDYFFTLDYSSNNLKELMFAFPFACVYNLFNFVSFLVCLLALNSP